MFGREKPFRAIPVMALNNVTSINAHHAAFFLGIIWICPKNFVSLQYD